MYRLAACLLIRGENMYLPEWLDWHFNTGVEHVYIYDNNTSDEPVSASVQSEYSTDVTVIEWHHNMPNMQKQAYSHCIENYGSKCEWLAFLDSDEFLNPSSDVQQILKKYRDYGALYVNWRIFGANNQERYSDEPVRHRFTEQSQSPLYRGLGKLIVQPQYILSASAHNAVFTKGKKMCDERFLIIPEGCRWFRHSEERIVIDHYYTKSYEEWCNKILRGTCDPRNPKQYSEFFEFNPDMRHLFDLNFQTHQFYTQPPP